MYSEIQDAGWLFFSPARNALPRHVRIDFAPVRWLKQVGVSLWLHLEAHRVIEKFGLERLNLHTGPGGVLLARRLPIPVIVTCHHTYRQQCRHLASQFWKRIFIPFEKRSYELATRIVAVSDATRQALIDDYGIAPEKITTIFNAVDTTRFHPLAAGKDPDTVVYVGRIDRRKGIEFLIRSFPAVVARRPRVHLYVGGKGSHLERMRALSRRLGIAENVTFLGFVPDQDLNALYNKAQCVVVPSVFEGFGITVIEAIAAGTRVVGTDSDGIREILAGDEYGRTVTYGNRAALAQAILDELEHPRPAPPLRDQYRLEAFRAGYLRELVA
ncbi:glycosyltransferase family 4 protein [Geomonas sp. Red875]|uniref:Glycosyltransferase family 4 protein n=2 Tax=Geomesophilobacter sediminis TaxID=2798584 RepID=A0A8J7M2C6_9BACT|nr:glycosyltransferase family 4 protein [Geomesophilobacter sediminis]